LSPALLRDLIEGLRAVLPLADGAEVTVEANPESVTAAGLREAAEAGVNRVSIGAQSFAPRVLRALGRTHSVEQAANAVAAARAMLENAGYRHYEISNWARPGLASRHNLLYWTQGDYVGLGIGAHSHRDGHRSWNTRALGRYLADPAGARDGEEDLTGKQRAE